MPRQLLSSLCMMGWSICCKACVCTCPSKTQTNTLEVHSLNHYPWFPRCCMLGAVQIEKNRQGCYKEVTTGVQEQRQTQVQSWRVKQHSRESSGWKAVTESWDGSGWMESLILPPAPAGIPKLPAAKRLVGILSPQDFSLYLRCDIQNVAAKIENLPNVACRSREILSALMTVTDSQRKGPTIFL